MTYYDEGNLLGWLAHPHLEIPVNIENVPQLLFQLDEILVQTNNSVKSMAFEKSTYKKIECLATLRIRILTHENYSWKGSLRYDEQDYQMSFHSVFELIKLIDEYLAN